MKSVNLRLTQYKFCALVCVVSLLSACTSGPTPSAKAPVLSAKATPLAEKDKLVYADAISALGKGKYSEAVTSLKRIADSNPGYLDAWVNLALANYLEKNNEDAKVAIEHANMLRPQSAEISNIQGLISAEDGYYNDAERLYLHSLQLDPNNANTHYNLALVYDVYYQDIAKAIPHYESYLSLSAQVDEETKAWTEELKRTLQRRNAR